MSEPKSATLIVRMDDGSIYTYQFHEGSQIAGAMTRVDEHEWTPIRRTDVPFKVTHHYRLDIVAGPGSTVDGTVMTLTVTHDAPSEQNLT